MYDCMKTLTQVILEKSGFEKWFFYSLFIYIYIYIYIYIEFIQ